MKNIKKAIRLVGVADDDWDGQDGGIKDRGDCWHHFFFESIYLVFYWYERGMGDRGRGGNEKMQWQSRDDEGYGPRERGHSSKLT